MAQPASDPHARDAASGFVSLLAPWSSFPMRIQPAAPIGDEDLFELCSRNRNLRIERTAQGDLIVMPPTGTETGRRNAALTTQLGAWSKRDARGIHFDSSTGFLLPSGAERSPDASWVEASRWAAIPREEREKFARLCPDFVVELASPSDSVDELASKLEEWIAAGARLGWLIVPSERRTGVFRPGRSPEWLTDPPTLSGDPELPGFVLDLAEIW